MNKQELVHLEPEILEIPLKAHDKNPQFILKVKNLTPSPIASLNFSIYHPDKFLFSPERFNLQPYEEKLVIVQLKPQPTSMPFKEFAYLKSPCPLISKRLTIFVGSNGHNTSFLNNSSKYLDEHQPSESIEIDRKTGQDEEDPNSLSNRGYQLAQAKAHGKMIMEKDSLIDRLEMEVQSKVLNSMRFQEDLKATERELELERRINGELRGENQELARRLGECEVSIARSQKEMIVEEQRRKLDIEEVNRLYRREIDDQKRVYELQLNRYQMRISELEANVRSSTANGIDKFKLQQELRLKEDELQGVRIEMQNMRIERESLENEKLLKNKFELENSRLGEEKQSLMQRITTYTREIEQFKQEMVVSRIEVEKRLAADKHTQCRALEISLDELRTENEVLLRKKMQLQNSLETAHVEIDLLKRRNSPIKNNEYTLTEPDHAKEENAVLVQKIQDLQNRGCGQCQRYARVLEEVERQRSEAREELDQAQKLFLQEKAELKEQEEQHTKALRRQLQQLNTTTVLQLKKLNAEKKKLKKELKSEIHDRNESTIHMQNSQEQSKMGKLQHEMAEMREELMLVKTQQKTSEERKVGIRRQSREIEESRTSKTNSVLKDDRAFEELGQLRELQKIIHMEQRRMEEHHGITAREGIFGVVDMFRVIREKLNTENQWWRQEESEYLHEIKELKLRLVNLEGREKENEGNNMSNLEGKHRRLFELIQEEMRSQYRKLNETVQLLQEKYQVFKKKIMAQFRSKLMEILAKKDKKEISKLEPLLERLLESVFNTSHKEALFSREVKRKLQLRKQNKELRGKVSQLQWLLADRKGVCSRDSIKVILNREDDLFENIKLEAVLMTCQAENERLKEEIDVLQEGKNSILDQQRSNLETLHKREEDISRLKAEIVEIDSLHRQQLSNAVTELELMKGQFLKITELEQRVSTLNGKERENQDLKDDLHRKKEIIKSLKEKEKAMAGIIDSTQRELEHQQHSVDKGRSREENRMQEIIGDLKEKNKQLKGEVEKKEEAMRQLRQDLEKKNAFLASQKMASSNSTTREREKLETYTNQIEQLKEENRKLADKIGDMKTQASKQSGQIDNLKSKLSDSEKSLTKFHNELKNYENEYLIKEKSLQSVVRGLVEMTRRLWRFIEIKVRKASPEAKIKESFDDLARDQSNVDVIRLYSGFETMLNLIHD